MVTPKLIPQVTPEEGYPNCADHRHEDSLKADECPEADAAYHNRH